MTWIALLAAAPVVVATQAAPATPPVAPLPPPGPDAMAVAAALQPPLDLATWEARMTQELLRSTVSTRGIGCDEADPRCSAAAAAIAARYAPDAADAARQRHRWYLAAILQDRMTPETLQATASFMATPAGQRYATGLRAILNPEILSPSLYRSMLAALPTQKTWAFTSAAEAFFDATRTLPRSRRKVPPPSPVYVPPAPPPVMPSDK